MQEALLGTTVVNSIVIWYVFPPGFLIGDTRLHLKCHRVVGVRCDCAFVGTLSDVLFCLHKDIILIQTSCKRLV